MLILRGMDTLSWETFQSKSFCLLSEKGSTPKGKNLLSFKFFPCRVYPFSVEDWCAGKWKEVKNIVLFSAQGELLWLVSLHCASSVVRHQQFALKAYSSYTPGPIDWNLVGSTGVTCRSNIAKIVLIGNPRWPPAILENLFFASSPKPKGQLICNLVGSIGVTCKSKKAKIVRIRNPRWPLSWKSIFRFFSWNKRPIVLKIGRKHRSD